MAPPPPSSSPPISPRSPRTPRRLPPPPRRRGAGSALGDHAQIHPPSPAATRREFLITDPLLSPRSPRTPQTPQGTRTAPSRRPRRPHPTANTYAEAASRTNDMSRPDRQSGQNEYPDPFSDSHARQTNTIARVSGNPSGQGYSLPTTPNRIANAAVTHATPMTMGYPGPNEGYTYTPGGGRGRGAGAGDLGYGHLRNQSMDNLDEAGYLKGDDQDLEYEKEPLAMNEAGMGMGGDDGPRYDTYPPGGLPYSSTRPNSVASTSTTTTGAAQTEAGFIHRQTALPKRGGTKKRVNLTGDGHWVNEYPVPRPVLAATEAQWRDSSTTSEFTHMRYTAATCDPDDFTSANGWSLRTSNYGRDTELLIAVTSYNEDKILYSRSLHALMLNIRDICKTKASKFWRHQAESGRPPWQKITVALIADGLGPMNVGVLDLLATVGVYQDGVLKKEIDGKKTTAHIFEYTTQISVDATPSLVIPHANDPNNLVPVQVIFCLKQENGKKINSHRWLFNAFGRMLKPEICILIDAGTRPGHKAIYYLWEAFYNNKNLGGACGEITAMLNRGKKLLNPLVAAQNFEYKMSNILDKPLESFFGYVTVLPGAFSAYRYAAIQGRPLDTYFLGDHTLAGKLGSKGIAGMGIFKQNSYLAEDRLLCFELVAKRNSKYTLTYVQASKAETDVPESAAELISQRRRWLNGSFAATVYSLLNFFRLYQSSHGPIRMFIFHVQAIYSLANLIFGWLALATGVLTFTIIINLLVDPSGVTLFVNATVTKWVNLGCTWVFFAVMGGSILLALGNRPKAEPVLYMSSFVIYAILAAYTIVCSAILSVKAFQGVFDGNQVFGKEILSLFSSTNAVLVGALLSTFGYYLLGSILAGDVWHMFHSFPAFLLLAFAQIYVINVYAFANLHDVSWGTKGSDKAEVLPTVNSSAIAGGVKVVDDVFRDQDEVDDQFASTVRRAVRPMKEDQTKEKPSVDDQNRTFRTRLFGLWLISNAILVLGINFLNGYSDTEANILECFPEHSFVDGDISSINGTCVAAAAQLQSQELHQKQGMFFRVILFSFFILCSIKFLGAVLFWGKVQISRLWRKN